MKLHVTNTLSGRKEQFEEPSGKVSLYVCGITPYDFAHLGHGRCYVFYDMVYRFLQFLGYQVNYSRNFTDIDDKLLDRAQVELQDRFAYQMIARRYIKAYHEDMAALGCMRPDFEPLVTEHIPEIIAFVRELLNADKAYQVDGDVYFSIDACPTYGALSKRNLENLRAGARVEVDKRKRNSLDFALWKAETAGTFFKSPWGWGRPGWHIECSALSRKYLPYPITMHGGGMDLIFPHHENERAQSYALYGDEFVRYWVHNAFVMINKEKMSKSLGNFFTLRQVFEKYAPAVLRYYFLQHQYRAPLDFTPHDLEATGKSYQRLAAIFDKHSCEQCSKSIDRDLPLIQSMVQFLCDDFNTSGMWGVVFDALPLIKQDEMQLCAVKKFMTQVLGCHFEVAKEVGNKLTPEIESLLKERERARAAKDFKRADEIRARLALLGFQVQDKKTIS